MCVLSAIALLIRVRTSATRSTPVVMSHSESNAGLMSGTPDDGIKSRVGISYRPARYSRLG